MELLYKDIQIGYIKKIYTEDNWIYGVFEKNDIFQDYGEFLKGIVCEDGFDESKFDCELLVDENWSINDNGKVAGIFIPAIYDYGEISFRYR